MCVLFMSILILSFDFEKKKTVFILNWISYANLTLNVNIIYVRLAAFSPGTNFY